MFKLVALKSEYKKKTSINPLSSECKNQSKARSSSSRIASTSRKGAINNKKPQELGLHGIDEIMRNC